jgi:uncharacterized membrane protein
MNGTEIAAVAGPTQDERTFATLAHALQVAGWWIAPLIILLVKRESRFVKFHALQALLWQICVVIMWLGVMLVWFGVFFSFVLKQMPAAPGAPPQMPPPEFFILMPLMWLAAFGTWVVTMILAILYAIKSGRGEWANYPLLGSLARRMLKL